MNQERLEAFVKFAWDQLRKPAKYPTCEWCGPLKHEFIHQNDCPIVEVLNHPVILEVMGWIDTREM